MNIYMTAIHENVYIGDEAVRVWNPGNIGDESWCHKSLRGTTYGTRPRAQSSGRTLIGLMT